ncbi:J domain-containing protein [Candidatus Mesenet endosymbiont of Phosphuga atrata]|uniref:J domain-containing protein n=1 Tax=Candidatus Mesenet endosymbiont of Phosphuga atrata TaxID=3066221 RepID=UPI0030D557D3
MGKYLTKREFEYKSDLFEALGIKKEDAVGKNFEQLSQLIGKQYRTLSLKCHPDKFQNSSKEVKDENDKKFQILDDAKKRLSKYILPLQKEQGSLIIPSEYEEFLSILQSKHEFSRRGKMYLLYALSFLFISLLSLVSYCYLISKLVIKCQSISLNLSNASFYGALICFIAFPISFFALTCFAAKDLSKIKNSEECLDQEDLVNKLEDKFSKKMGYKPLILLMKCLPTMAIILTAASLITESALNNFKTVDTKLLIGVSLLILSFGLKCLADEVYERKVVNLVKEERAEGKLDEASIKGPLLAIEYNV